MKPIPEWRQSWRMLSVQVAAVAVAGIPVERWRFVGFLPRRATELLELLDRDEATVAFESPKRLPATLRAIADADPSRLVAVCRELTKLHEEVVRGPAGEVAERFADGARGEITLVVAATPAAEGDRVAEGDVLLVLESRKMELSITAPCDGVVSGLELAPGDRVALKQPLVAVVPDEEEPA